LATLLFRLNGVPEDEADDVRELLLRHQIDFYETQAGRWGFSVAAIWLREDAEAPAARALIEEYQRERTRRVREESAALRRAGQHETLLDRLKRRPVTALVYAAIILGILYLSLMPFLRLG
jgi:hypothetical protein